MAEAMQLLKSLRGFPGMPVIQKLVVKGGPPSQLARPHARPQACQAVPEVQDAAGHADGMVLDRYGAVLDMLSRTAESGGP